MEGAIKSILSDFLQVAPDQIVSATVIDRSTLRGSIMVHRLYGALANAGVMVSDYLTIRTYGELLQKIGGTGGNENLNLPGSSEAAAGTSGGDGVGIDIEQVTAMPVATDFREDAFYTQNFTDHEISYCSIQSNPLESFAGLFAAKEAIAKASSRYQGTPFNRIEIDHDLQGRPVKKGFQVSISHVQGLSVAVAVTERSPIVQSGEAETRDEVVNLLQEQIALLRKQSRRFGQFILLLVLVIVAMMVYSIFKF